MYLIWSYNIGFHTIVPILVLLSQMYMLMVEAAKIRCSPVKEKPFNEINLYENQEYEKSCEGATKIALLDAKVLHAQFIDENKLKWIFDFEEINMCIVVERTNISKIIVKSEAIDGNCTGSILRIVNNDQLLSLMLNPMLVSRFSNSSAEIIYSEKAITVRGNRKLMLSSIKDLEQAASSSYDRVLDVQAHGECGLPTPFTDFVVIENCSLVYGPLSIDISVSHIRQSEKKFRYEGCLRIENTSLVDVDFLQSFSPFVAMPSCQQYIRFNKRLCIRNPALIYEVFGDVQIDGNNMACDCHGGIVTEEYLSNITGCTHIDGDLIITDWKNPQNADVLKNIESIYGRLIITNNTGLFNFTHFSKLKEVGTKYNGVVLIVKNNLDLCGLPLPMLHDITVSPEDARVDFSNNPKMELFLQSTPAHGSALSERPQEKTERTEETESLEKLTTEGTSLRKSSGQPTTLGESEDSNIDAGDVKERKTDEADDAWKNTSQHVILVGLVFVLAVAAMLLFIIVVAVSNERECALPPPPYELSRKSKEILASMCAEILEHSPLLWYNRDYHLCHTGKPEDLINDLTLSSALLLPVAPNACLPFVEKSFNKILHQRIRFLMNFDYVVMISCSYGTSRILPRIPINIGEKHTYVDEKAESKIVFRLLRRTPLSSNVVLFKYEIAETSKKGRSVLSIVFYRWLPNFLPRNYCELLQLAVFCAKMNAVCISDRRKEVFAFIRMIVTKVYKVKEKVCLAGVFREHSGACNGAPLDRGEMLYSMRFLLDWGWKAKCIPPQMNKKLEEWRTLYSSMSRYSEMHNNVRSIHPRHLHVYNKCLEKQLHALHACYNLPLYERKSSDMHDQFRMLLPTEKYNKADNRDKDKTDLIE